MTDAARHDGKMLRHLVTSDNLAASVWADSAYRSKANEAWLAGKGRVSHIHRKTAGPGNAQGEPPRPMPASQWSVRMSNMIFAQQKDRMACSSAPSGSSAPRPR